MAKWPELQRSSRNMPCDVCQGTDFRVLSRRDRRRRPLVTVVCCRCGLVSHETIPGDAELSVYYRKHYRREYHGEFTPSPHRVAREWNRGRQLFDQLRHFVVPASDVFEVGSGIGCNLMPFQLAGHQVTGIEPGEGFCRFSREQLRLDIQQKTLAEVPCEAQFDFILLVHVLEHLPKPVEQLARLRCMLRPEGRLYVEVPNLAAPHAAPKRLFHFAHIFNFTPTTLHMAARKAGLELQCMISPPRGRDLQAVFRLASSGESVPEVPDGYERSLEAYFRYTTLSYHLRPTYLGRRVRQIGSRVRQRYVAKRQLQAILAECEQAPQKMTTVD